MDLEKNSNCLNCNAAISGNFCSSCGQKVIQASDKTIKRFIQEFISNVFFADGKLIGTLKVMLTKPGELSRQYILGIRKRYMSPFQLFFFANFMYFLFPILSTFNTSLYTQLNRLPYSAYVKPIVADHLEQNEIQYEVFSSDFNTVSSSNGKLLLIILVLLQAGIFAVLFFRKSRFFFSDYLASAAYFNGLYILVLLVFVPSIIYLLSNFFEFEIHENAYLNEVSISLILVALILTYMTVFIKRAFQVSLIESFIKSLIASALLIPSFVVYRFILFWISFWMLC